jgi:hypothetical protein
MTVTFKVTVMFLFPVSCGLAKNFRSLVEGFPQGRD